MSTEKNTDVEAAAVPEHMLATAELFRKFPDHEYNRLLPSLTIADGKGELYRPHIEVVKINPKLPEKNENGFDVPGSGGGEVYEDKRVRGVVMLSRRALQKLQITAGVIFPPQLQKLTWNATSAHAQAAGAMKKSDGSLMIVTRSKIIDLDVEAAKLTDQAERSREYHREKGNASKILTDEQIAAKVKHDLIQVRENMPQNAETKAQNRVIRAVLALKDSYTIVELAKPFVLIRFDQVFDMNDPRQMQAILIQAQSSQALLYPPAPVEASPDSRLDMEIKNATINTEDGDKAAETEKQVEADPPADTELSDMDEPVPMEEATKPSVDYGELKKRYVAALNRITKDEGEREKRLFVWRMVHNQPKDDRLSQWIDLVAHIEGQVPSM